MYSSNVFIVAVRASNNGIKTVIASRATTEDEWLPVFIRITDD